MIKQGGMWATYEQREVWVDNVDSRKGTANILVAGNGKGAGGFVRKSVKLTELTPRS